MFDQLNSKAPHTQNKFPVSQSAPECPTVPGTSYSALGCPMNSDTGND